MRQRWQNWLPLVGLILPGSTTSTTYLDVDCGVLVKDAEDDVIDDYLVLHVPSRQLSQPARLDTNGVLQRSYSSGGCLIIHLHLSRLIV